MGAPGFLGLADFERFGQTSLGFPKAPHNIEVVDEFAGEAELDNGLVVGAYALAHHARHIRP